MQYTTIEELLADDGFIAWYFQSNKQQIATWNNWIANCEQNRMLAEQAIFFLQCLWATGAGAQADAGDLWNRIQAEIQKADNS